MLDDGPVFLRSMMVATIKLGLVVEKLIAYTQPAVSNLRALK